MFGQVVSGMNILTDIGNVPNDASNDNLPFSPVTITSATVTTDNNDFALALSAALNTTASGNVTVTANDGHGGITSQTFQVTVQPDTNDPPPFLTAITPPSMPVNVATSFTLPAFDLEGDPLTFTNMSGTIPGLTVSVNASSGLVTLTPSAGLTPGVKSLFFGVTSAVDSTPDTQAVPLFVDPAAPTGISLLAASDTGSSSSDNVTSLNNANASSELQFSVTGLTVGDTVILLDGSTQIGSIVATASTMTVKTNGTTSLSNGTHQITAEQLLPNQSYTVGNTSGTTSLTSPPTAARSDGRFDDAALHFVPRHRGNHRPSLYRTTAQVSDSVPTGIAYTLVSAPAGFSINASTGVVTWTPTAAQIGNNVVQIRRDRPGGQYVDPGVRCRRDRWSAGDHRLPPRRRTAHLLAGQSISILVTFAEPVNVTGTPQLALNDGGVASYVSGSGTATLAFNYTVGANQKSPFSTTHRPPLCVLNGGTIADPRATRTPC